MEQPKAQVQGNPLVSVCVPTYNYARFLPDCIESVLQQTFTEWELVVTDDCSEDGTAELVQGYARSDLRIRYVRNQQRLGMNPNLQRAADSGRGRYLKILCADDWLASQCLEVLFRLMEEHPRVVLATCAEIHCDEFGTPLRQQFLFGRVLSVIPGNTMLDRMASLQGFGGNSSFFIRTCAYRKIGGYDPTVLYAGDWELAGRLCRVGDYLHTDEPLFYGRTHPLSSSSNDPKKLWDVIDRFTIPFQSFRPRSFMNREWRRYHRANILVTGQSLVNVVISYGRGNRAYARKLLKLVRKLGNLPLGLLYAPFHALARLYRYVHSHRTVGPALPPEAGMGRPSPRTSADPRACLTALETRRQP